MHHTVAFPDGEVIHFRNYASAGALYLVEVYVACVDLPGLPADVYHFDPAGRALTRLRGRDHRANLLRAAASEPAVARAPVVLTLTGIPWRTASPLCLVPVGLGAPEGPPAGAPPEQVSFEVAPLSGTEHVYQGILEANDAGRLDTGDEGTQRVHRRYTERQFWRAPGC